MAYEFDRKLSATIAQVIGFEVTVRAQLKRTHNNGKGADLAFVDVQMNLIGNGVAIPLLKMSSIKAMIGSKAGRCIIMPVHGERKFADVLPANEVRAILQSAIFSHPQIARMAAAFERNVLGKKAAAPAQKVSDLEATIARLQAELDAQNEGNETDEDEQDESNEDEVDTQVYGNDIPF